MKAKCWVGGCDWEMEDEHSVPLDIAAEDHRADKHFWVKPGRVHRIILDPVEPVEEPAVQPSGKTVRLKTPKAMSWG